jgi:hypothetical protein
MNTDEIDKMLLSILSSISAKFVENERAVGPELMQQALENAVLELSGQLVEAIPRIVKEWYATGPRAN